MKEANVMNTFYNVYELDTHLEDLLKGQISSLGLDLPESFIKFFLNNEYLIVGDFSKIKNIW